MIDDESPEEESVGQDAVDDIFGEDGGNSAGGEGGDTNPMSLDEISDPADEQDQENPYKYGEAMAQDVAAIYDIPVQISAVLGRSTMQVSQLLNLGRGAVVQLDRKVGEAIDIYVNNRLVARGEVVVVEDKLGVTMTEIVKSERS